MEFSTESIISTEQCFYCNNKAEYSQVVTKSDDNYIVSYVCKKHFVMGLSS